MTTIALPRPAPPAPDGPAPAPGPARRWRRLVTGPPADPGWARPALLVLLGATAVLYLWGLGASGWANSFYSAAVEAGAHSWKAFFFGSSDAASFITVDKPPAALWVMELSARAFGVNAWSILVPQALEGVATVALVYATVRRWFGAGAGLLGAAVVALTPAAALMFRYNNPDALLVLLLTASAYATVRAIDSGRTRWLVLAGVLVGTGFLTKMLQAFLVVPALALAYLIAGPPQLGRRIGQLLIAGAALVVASLWWVVAVMAIPAADRPFIGGSQNNSLWNLIFGYNGFGRLTGNESGSVGGGAATTTGRWGITGLVRMFNTQFGGGISWLLPAALLLLAAGLVVTWRRGRTDRTRAALVLWGGWLGVTAAVFSLGRGIIHPYYTIALAPAIGGIVGVGGATFWRHRAAWTARAVLAAAVAVGAIWSYVLLDRTPTWHPLLRELDLAAGLAAAALLLLAGHVRRTGVVIALGGIVAAVAGSAAYTLATAALPHTGAIPSAGPSVAAALGGPGGGPGGPGRRFGGGFAGRRSRTNGGPPTGFAFPGGGPGFTVGGGLGGGAGGGPGLPGGQGPGLPGGQARGGGPGGGRGGLGGLLDGSTPNAAVTSALEAGAGRYTWVAATIGSNNASGYQLATSDPVMAIGGFNGTDPAPSLAQFELDVSQHRIHYFIPGGGGPGAGGTSSVAGQITSWVEGHFTATTIGGVTLYDLTAPVS